MINNIKKPKRKGVAKVPVVMQLESLECGAACLSMILAYYGKWIPLEEVREASGVSRDGSNAQNMLLAAKHYGLKVNAYKYEIDELKNEGTFPCIIHWNFNHFVVLDGFRGDKVYINDPSKGTYTISMDVFDKSYTGVVLFMEPDDNFMPSGKKKSVLSFALKRLGNDKTNIIFFSLVFIITSIFAIFSQGFSRIYYDRIITGINPTWIKPYFLAYIIFIIIRIILAFVSDINYLHLDGKLSLVGNTTYLWKVLHLPMTFFSQRSVGDIQMRQMKNASISNILINQFTPLLFNLFMAIFYFVIMFRYNIFVSIVAFIGLIINMILSTIFSKVRINISRQSEKDSAKYYSTMVSGMEMIESIKASGAENGYFGRWAAFQTNYDNNLIKFEKLNQISIFLLGFINLLIDALVLLVGIYLCMEGKWTPGMIIIFQGLIVYFMGPARTLIEAGQVMQEMRVDMERVEDVMEYLDDQLFKKEEICEDYENLNNKSYHKLTGEINIRNVTFGYAPFSEPLIKDFSLSIKAGESIAIVGTSGCGKSTIAKLISGLYKPWEGEILFDGKKHKEIDKDVFRSSLAVVDQDIILFEGTVEDNITMWDNSIENYEMRFAARDAQIHKDIMAKENGYKHRLEENGKDFSGGQRQRLEIARVMAVDPMIIIFDEATSSLDSKTEYDIVKSIKNRGITTIIISHRLSAIRYCNKIVVIDNGKIVGEGTHDELIENNKIYKNLVTLE